MQLDVTYRNVEVFLFTNSQGTGYGVNNPLFYIDADGLDAIAAGFETLAANSGHMAVLSVHDDGSVTFGSYGPRGGSKPLWFGQYVVQGLRTKVTFDTDYLPTKQSLSALASEVADIEGVPKTSVTLDYFRTSESETAALDYYLGVAKTKQQHGKAPFYCVGVSDCRDFALGGLSAAGIVPPRTIQSTPNILIDILSFQAGTVYYGSTDRKVDSNNGGQTPDVHSVFRPCSSDNPCPVVHTP